ncbi:hypothetical protein [uncultured Salinicola sp.]|uniref:hypothetical protein n=1 Tax=uncultured Salinicola sp. TaxID=1193542 RepID=UPI0026159CA0|nr:hypothetical protein [uncultured Salinicola sp.]
MRPSVGTRDQIVARMDVLTDLDRKARALQRYVEKHEDIEDPFEVLHQNGILAVVPFFTMDIENGHNVLKLDDDIVHPLRIDYERPRESLWEISQCFRLPGVDEGYHPWHDGIAARYEKELRRCVCGEIIETDGFTAWVLALEGMKGKGEDMSTADAVRDEIAAALAERRMPAGSALTFIRKGHERLSEPGQDMISGTAHWEYDDKQTYSAIAKTEIGSSRCYEGIRITSNCRFNSRYSIEGSVLKLNIPAIPESTVLSLTGKSLEQVVNDTRLHGWGLRVRGIMRNERNRDGRGNEISTIFLETNRGDDETRLCFGTRYPVS